MQLGVGIGEQTGGQLGDVIVRCEKGAQLVAVRYPIGQRGECVVAEVEMGERGRNGCDSQFVEI